MCLQDYYAYSVFLQALACTNHDLGNCLVSLEHNLLLLVGETTYFQWFGALNGRHTYFKCWNTSLKLFMGLHYTIFISKRIIIFFFDLMHVVNQGPEIMKQWHELTFLKYHHKIFIKQNCVLKNLKSKTTAQMSIIQIICLFNFLK